MPDSPVRLPPGPLGSLLTLLVPLTLGLGWWAWMTRPVPQGEVSPKLALFDQMLAAEPPRVVVLGNSIVRMSIDDEALEEALGLDEGVVKLTIDGSTSAHWYAILQHHVFEQGYRPDLVLVPNLPAFALDVAHPAGLVRARLLELLRPDDVLVRAKSNGGPPPPLWRDRLDQRRLDVRALVFEGIKGLSVAALFGGDPTLSPVPRGLAVADPALQRVFGAEGAVDLDLHQRAIPIVEAQGPDDATSPVTVEGSLMPDLVALASAHGARLLFVDLPSLPDPYIAARQPAEAVAELIALLNEAPAAGYLDLTGLPVTASDFSDTTHLNRTGTAILSQALAAYVREVDVLGDAPFPRALPPLRPESAVREGMPDPLPEVTWEPWTDVAPCCRRARLDPIVGIDGASLWGRGLLAVPPLRVDTAQGPLQAVDRPDAHACSGTFRHHRWLLEACTDDDGPLRVSLDPALPVSRPAAGPDTWWAYPGTTLAWTFASLTAPARLRAAFVHVAGTGEATLSLDGEPVPTERRDQRALATTELPVGRPWTLSLDAPPGGPFAVVTALTVVQEDQQRVVTGNTASLAGPPLRLVTGRSARRVSTVEGPPVDEPVDTLPERRGGVAFWPLPALGALSDRARHGRFLGRACNPLRVLEDGVPLPHPNASLRDLREGKPGYVLDAEGVWLVGTQGPPDADSASRYTFQRISDLPEPRCQVGTWVHAGQTLDVRSPDTGPLLGGADLLEVLATSWGPRVDLAVLVYADDALVHEGTLDTALLGKGVVRRPLDAHIPAATREVRLRLSVPPGGPSVLLDGLNLVERPFPAVIVEPSEPPPSLALMPATATEARLEPGDDGVVLHLDTPSFSRACLPPRPTTGPLRLEATATIRALSPTERPWHTVSLSLRWLDARGAAVVRDDRPAQDSARFDPSEPARQQVAVQGAPPPGATQALACVEPAPGITGAVQIHAIQLTEVAP